MERWRGKWALITGASAGIGLALAAQLAAGGVNLILTARRRERLDGQHAEVRTKLRSSKVEIPMDYRLINKGGWWYAYDIVVDGVSLVKNYRSQFTAIIRSDSYGELVRRFRDRSIVEEKEEKR